MSTAKKSLIGAGVGVVLLLGATGGAYFSGYRSGLPAVAEAQRQEQTATAELSEAQASHAAEVRDLRASLAAQTRRAQLLEARRQLAVALDQLDARNFGLGQQHCQQAARELSAVEDAEAEVVDLAAQLDSYRFEVGGNFDQSRQQLRAFASTLDGLVGTAEPGSGE